VEAAVEDDDVVSEPASPVSDGTDEPTRGWGDEPLVGTSIAAAGEGDGERRPEHPFDRAARPSPHHSPSVALHADTDVPRDPCVPWRGEGSAIEDRAHRQRPGEPFDVLVEGDRPRVQGDPGE